MCFSGNDENDCIKKHKLQVISFSWLALFRQHRWIVTNKQMVEQNSQTFWFYTNGGFYAEHQICANSMQ